MDFELGRIALHYVDPQEGATVLSDALFDIDTEVEKEDEREIVRDYLRSHLHSMWDNHSEWAVGADLDAEGSDVEALLAAASSPTCYLTLTRRLACRLQSLSPTVASPGLLMAVAFHPLVDDVRGDAHVALVKLDPGARDLLTLQRQNGRILLELAVEHIELALPEAGRRVLKWAIHPNPDNPGIALKIYDRQSQREPAVYFTRFLGAKLHRSDADLVADLVDALESYAVAEHHDEAWADVIPQWQHLINEMLGRGRSVTRSELARAVAKSGALPGTDPAALAVHLEEHGIGRVAATEPAMVGKRKLHYELDNGITISGKEEDVLGLVKIERTAVGALTFRITAARYDRRWSRR